MIGGNINALIQIRNTQKNAIGEAVQEWKDVGTVLGWLDYSSGENSILTFKGKIQDTTHMFLCDYSNYVTATQDEKVTSENARMMIDGNVYQILMIDDPMGLHQHIEIYLKYVGGGLGVS